MKDDGFEDGDTENIKRKFSIACRRKHSTINAVLKKFMIEYSSHAV